MDGSFFCTDFSIRTTLKFEWGVRRNGLFKLKGLFMMSNPEMCTDLFVVMFKLEGGWVFQNQSEHC